MGRNKGRISATYVGAEYDEALDEHIRNLGVTRYQYLRGLVIRDMVAKGVLDPLEVRRADRYLLET